MEVKLRMQLVREDLDRARYYQGVDLDDIDTVPLWYAALVVESSGGHHKTRQTPTTPEAW